MTQPKRWTPGDPLTAERLNQVISESVRPRRDISLGNGSSLVNETMGNQSATGRFQQIKLVVAVSDFAISETPTDIAAHADDVPSGYVKEVRLNRRSGTHSQDSAEKPFLAYDPVSELDGTICTASSDSASGSDSGSASTSESGTTSTSKMMCDVFYVIYNLSSKRWEVLAGGGGGIELYHGVILSKCNTACSTYKVQRVHRYLESGCPECASDSASASESV
jgi:hypothetical protein